MTTDEFMQYWSEFINTVKGHYPTNQELCTFFFNKGIEYATKQQEGDYTGCREYDFPKRESILN